MIHGYFDQYGRPYVEGRLIIERLGIHDRVQFLVDTGADSTALHPWDGERLNCRYDLLVSPRSMGGVGGEQEYYSEDGAIITFYGEDTVYTFTDIRINIAKPTPGNRNLPSLLGNDVLGLLRMDYHRSAGLLRLYHSV